MKLSLGLVLAATLVVGSLVVTGCSKSADEDATDEGATTEQASVAGEQAVAMNEGFTQDARCGQVRGAHRGERASFRHAGFRRGEGWRGDRVRGARRAWWRW